MPPDAVELQPSFQFEGFVFDRVCLDVLPLVPVGEGETLQPGIALQMTPSATVTIDHDKKRAELRLSFRMVADPKKQPYIIDISIHGRFALQAGSIAHLIQFAQVGAPSVLFPFVREMVYTITKDAAWGPLRLNPINLQPILKWRQEPPSETKKKEPKRKGATKRELIPPRGEEPDGVDLSQKADRRTKAKTRVKSGQGDKGDR